MPVYSYYCTVQIYAIERVACNWLACIQKVNYSVFSYIYVTCEKLRLVTCTVKQLSPKSIQCLYDTSALKQKQATL